MKRKLLPPPLGLVLILSTAVLMAVLFIGSMFMQRQMKSTLESQIEKNAHGTSEALSRKLRQQQLPPLECEKILSESSWLEPTLSLLTREETYIEYVALSGPSGQVIAFSMSTTTNITPREFITELPRVGKQNRRHHHSHEGLGPLVDYGMPISIDSSQLALHIGVSEPKMEQHLEKERSWLKRALWIVGLLSIINILGVAGAVWAFEHKARMRDVLAIRKDHLAEVGKLAGGLVHEIRNPLNAMRMQIAVLRSKFESNRPVPKTPSSSSVAASQLDRLEGEVLRLQDLATDFLAFGRPPRDHMETISPAQAVSEHVEFIRPELEKQGINLHLSCDPEADSARVTVDRGKLKQVLLNLTRNAQQAMPDGGDLYFLLERTTAKMLRISVRDTGAGIPENILPRIFEPFFSTKDDGNGLGLASARQMIEAANGTLTISTREPTGTTFSVELPLSKEPTSTT